MRSAALGFFVLAACVQETQPLVPDAGAPDELLFGFGHPGLGLSEGGELRLERMTVEPSIAPQDIVLAQAYFLEEGARGEPLPDVGRCSRLFVTGEARRWPIVDLPNKVYSDVGPELRLDNGNKTIALQRFNGDALADNVPGMRRHQILYGGPQQSRAIAAGEVEYGTHYRLDYDDETKLHRPNVLVPRDFEVTTPPVGRSPLTFERGADVIFEYESLAPRSDVTTHDPDRVFALVAFVDLRLSLITHLCLAAPSGPGRLIVSAEILDEVAREGVLLFSQFTHFLDERKGRRFDILGISSKLSRYQVK